MNCCKEKDCCPCADRIDCLQAQIKSNKADISELVKALEAAGILTEIKTD